MDWLKRGTPSVHPIRGPEIRALRRLESESQSDTHCFHVCRHFVELLSKQLYLFLLVPSCSDPITSSLWPDNVGLFGTTLADNIGRLGPHCTDNRPTLNDNSPITSARTHFSG
jgi:hypothetical protein